MLSGANAVRTAPVQFVESCEWDFVKESLLHTASSWIGIPCSAASYASGLTLMRTTKGSSCSTNNGVASSTGAPTTSSRPTQRDRRVR